MVYGLWSISRSYSTWCYSSCLSYFVFYVLYIILGCSMMIILWLSAVHAKTMVSILSSYNPLDETLLLMEHSLEQKKMRILTEIYLDSSHGRTSKFVAGNQIDKTIKPERDWRISRRWMFADVFFYSKRLLPEYSNSSGCQLRLGLQIETSIKVWVICLCVLFTTTNGW